MTDCLLVGWKEIHETLFCKINGRPSISIYTLMYKHGSGLKRTGAVFRWRTGKGKKRKTVIAGWKSVIMNYFIRLGQEEEAEKAVQKSKMKGSN